MKSILKVLESLIFPKVCLACSAKRYNDDILGLCGFCSNELPLTFHFNYRDNLFEQRFWGRVPLQAGASLLFFHKASFVQGLIYKIKYDSARELACYLGELLGTALSESQDFETVEYLVPVPLHKRKERKRGYNQSLLICEGIRKTWDKPIFFGLKRKRNTKTQTKMGRLERLQNLDQAMIVETQKIEAPHFLIVDDVMTTGTTIEVCALALLDAYPNAKISVATLAFADLW